MRSRTLLNIAVFFISFLSLKAQNFTSTSGKVKFMSQAKLEMIKAESNRLMSVITGADRKFAFSLVIETFEGFNSPLQKEHFRENYMETHKYKISTFKGKIIEEIDFTKPGTYNVRAKGMFMIHGVEKEKIINAKLVVKSGQLEIEASFPVELNEYNIKIPKVVNQKIASTIQVEVKTTLNQK